MNYYIYKITNNVNNKIYIGCTTNVEKRWNKHIKVALSKRKKEKFYIHNAIQKYGVENFSIETLIEIHSKEQMFSFEKKYIEEYKSNKNDFGYNLTEGGEGAFGRVLSKETKDKISKAHLGIKHSDETKELLRKINLGKKQSSESIEKTRQANIGKTISEEHKKKLREFHTGKIVSNETKNKMKTSLKKKYLESEDYRNKCLEALVKATKYGENNSSSKLKEIDVINIRRLNKNGVSSYRLSKIYKMSKSSILSVVNFKTWKHVKDQGDV